MRTTGGAGQDERIHHMSVSSVGSGTSLYQWLQQVQANGQQTSGATAGQVAGQDSDGDTDGSQAAGATAASAISAGATGGAHHGHHGHHGHPQVSSQLQSAVTSALNSANGSTDPNQTIQDAIKNFLGLNSTSSTQNSTSTDPTQTSTTTTPGDSTVQQQPGAFAQLLASNGVSEDQFKQDLHSVLQDAQSSGTAVNFGQIFGNLPSGSLVDTTA